jgi:hypothetical protein
MNATLQQVVFDAHCQKAMEHDDAYGQVEVECYQTDVVHLEESSGGSISAQSIRQTLTAEYISGPKVARKIAVDPATIRRWVREGAPHYILGDRLVRFKLDELLAWRKTHRRSATKA